MPEIQEKIKPIIARYKNKEWKPFLEDELPKHMVDMLHAENVFEQGGAWLCGMVYYKGVSPETATEILIVLDDGGAYKVFAQFAFWHIRHGENVRMQCVWSYSHLKKTMRSYIETGNTIFDPQYHT